jgi:hypothetical protein
MRLSSALSGAAALAAVTALTLPASAGSGRVLAGGRDARATVTIAAGGVVVRADARTSRAPTARVSVHRRLPTVRLGDRVRRGDCAASGSVAGPGGRWSGRGWTHPPSGVPVRHTMSGFRPVSSPLGGCTSRSRWQPARSPQRSVTMRRVDPRRR